MLFGSLSRLRTEMARLVVAQAGKIKDGPQREAFTSTIYDGVVQRLRVSPSFSPLSPFSFTSKLTVCVHASFQVAFGTKKTEEEIEFWEGVRKRSG